MKIAIIGTDPVAVETAIKDALTEWKNYKSPSKNIFNITYPEDESTLPEDFREWVKDYNEDEKKILYKLDLLMSQREQYKDETYLFYWGCGIDLICEAVVKNEAGIISDEVVEKLIYYNKKLMRDLDAIFWIPNELKDEDEGKPIERLEMSYGNLWDDYQHNLRSSPFFDYEDVPGFLRVDEPRAVRYMSYIINRHGNLASAQDDDEMVDYSQMQRLFKGAPDLLKALEEAKANKNLIKN